MYERVRDSACDHNDEKKQARLEMEALRIRQLYAKKEPDKYLNSLKQVAQRLADNGQSTQARQLVLTGMVFSKKQGLEQSKDGKALSRILKSLDRKTQTQSAQ